jgi:hypothetical protein
VYHQNIRGLSNKTDELAVSINNIPHILCLTEHHTKAPEIIISHPDTDCFQNRTNDVFASLNKWIKANKLTLNFDKTNFMKFCTNNKTCFNLNVEYDDKSVEEVERTKFIEV